MEGFVEQMVCNSSSLIAYFYATTTLLKKYGCPHNNFDIKLYLFIRLHSISIS